MAPKTALVKSSERRGPPANCNHGPINLRLDERGLTPLLMAGVFELVSTISCYGPTRRDRADLRAAAGLLGDVLNRMRAA